MGTYDMVCVMKDYSQPVKFIGGLPTKRKAEFITYLTQIGMVVYETGSNMQWPKFMKEICGDFKKFVAEGGWEAFFGEAEDDDEDQDDPDESEYSEDSDEEETSEEDDDSESYADESEESESEEEDDSGLDWDEMEARAKKQDREDDAKRKQQGEDGGIRAKRRRM